MSDILSNFHFWLFIALFIMIFILVSKSYGTVNEVLEYKIKSINNEINNSISILNDTKTILNEASNERNDIEKKLSEIYRKNKNNNDTYYEKYIDQLNAKLECGQKSFDNYLKIKYDISVLEHKKYIVDKSLQSVITYINNNVQETEHSKLIDESINNFADIIQQK